jgi:asparagine synthase (glutamine-hydrolysing)
VDTFVCLVDKHGRAIPDHLRRRYTWPRASAVGIGGWVSDGACSLRATTDGYGPPTSLFRASTGIAAGMVRLDNRAEIRRRTGCGVDAPDLALVSAALHLHGAEILRAFEGDFAFAYWDTRRAELIVARDAFGVRTLYQIENGDFLGFSSRASLLGEGRELSLDYIADYIAFNVSQRRTPYSGVERVAPGTYSIVKGHRVTNGQYWSPHDFDTNSRITEADAVEQFTGLFRQAVRLNLTDDATCWSQLSGGLDSSSVVSMAGWLVKHDDGVVGLSGTVSYVDTLGTGDEREYSDAVVRDWPVRNEQLIDYGLWEDDEINPPQVDMPDQTYASFARDQQACRIIRSAGGRVLLTGVGPDQYLFGNYVYFADLLARGRVVQVLRGTYNLATLGRGSFWKFAYENALRPLFGHGAPKPELWPGWVRPDFARRFPVHERHPGAWDIPPRLGRSFVTNLANNTSLIEHSMFRGVIGDTFDVRCPFLYRPLVEFCLQLPPAILARPRDQKWILRQAMTGVIPGEVRQRRTKGFIDRRTQRSFIDKRDRLNDLLSRSVLAELECIDAHAARDALANIKNSRMADNARLRHALTLEAWLTVRSGRWIAGDFVRPSSSVA